MELVYSPPLSQIMKQPQRSVKKTRRASMAAQNTCTVSINNDVTDVIFGFTGEVRVNFTSLQVFKKSLV